MLEGCLSRLKAHSRAFREDVVTVVPNGDATIKQMDKDFGISESLIQVIAGRCACGSAG